MMRSLTRTVIILSLVFLPFRLYGLTLSEEKQYGKQINYQIVQQTQVDNDPYLSMYIGAIADKLQKVARLPYPVKLTIIDAPEADAFATIGGYSYITTGLIGLCDTEQELAGVIAHEFAHIEKRHVAKRLEQQKYINATMLASMVLGMVLPDQKARDVAFTTGMASSQAIALKYSRQDEDEADTLGSHTAAKAGYGGLGIADFLKKLRTTEAGNIVPQYLLTHPYHESRIIKLQAMWQNKKPPVNASIFPYLLVRVKVLHGAQSASNEEIWLKRYEKDKDNPVSAYGAALVYSLKGDANKAITIVNGIDSPLRNVLMGEMLIKAQKFKEAIAVLKDDEEPVSLYFLGRAYEGDGDLLKAAQTYERITQFGNSFPDIYYRLGMVQGRMGELAQGYEYLGKYYLANGRLDLARSSFEKAAAKYGLNSRKGREMMKYMDDLREKKDENM